MRGIDIEDARSGLSDHGSGGGKDAADDRRVGDRRLKNWDDCSFDHPWRRSRRDRRVGEPKPHDTGVAECDHRNRNVIDIITDGEFAALIKPIRMKVNPGDRAQAIRSELTVEFDDPRVKGQWAADLMPEYVWDLVDIAAQRGINAGSLVAPVDGPAQRTAAVQALCRRDSGTERCFFPNCNGCGFDRMVDREAAADPGKIATREFLPDARQAIVANAIRAALGNVCATPEDAIALLTHTLSDYIEKVCKSEFRTEAFLTVIHCLRLNAGMENENDIPG